MKCQNCGYESKNLLYCPVCGEKIDINSQEVKQEVKEEDPFESYDKKEEKTTNSNYGPQYKVFAIIGYVLGIVSVAFCWVPFMFFGTVPGIVFSKIGDVPTNKQEFARRGFVLSLTGVIINVVFTIAFFVVMGILIANGVIEATN